MGCLSGVRDYVFVSRCLAHSILRPMMRHVQPSVFCRFYRKIGISERRRVVFRVFEISYAFLGVWRILFVGRRCVMLPRPLFGDFCHASRNIWQAMGWLSAVRDYLCVSRCLKHSNRRPTMGNVPPNVACRFAPRR